MIETIELTKRYGNLVAVDHATFTAAAGRVTGFLGLNGSGKTTTMRMLLGLAKPTSGRALIDGKEYRQLKHPMREIGAVVEQGVAHPGQTGRAHLRTHALLARAAHARIDEVLEQVGLTSAQSKQVGGYSLGMRQRLAIATALLTEPPVLVLDEPGNGLDPQGMVWLRGLLRDHADRGGTVLISSHLLGELALLVDDVVVISHGQILSTGPLADFTAQSAPRVRVRARDPQVLWDALQGAGAELATPDGVVIDVWGLPPDEVGEIAFAAAVPVYELTPHLPDLEQVFLDTVAEAA